MPYRPTLLSPAAHPYFREYLTIEEQEEVLVHLGPQGICDLLVACFGRGDKVWDELCIRALTESIRKGAFEFVRNSLADDLKLHFNARFRAACEEDWYERRGRVPSWLGGSFFRCSDLTTAQRLASWRPRGSLRVSSEREHS